MILLFVVLVALAKPILAFGAAATLAVLLRLVGRLARIRIPAFLRWGLGAFLVLVYAVATMESPDLTTMSRDTATFAQIAFNTEAIGYVFVILGLIGIGVVADLMMARPKSGVPAPVPPPIPRPSPPPLPK